jgi:hypothetical protein
MPYFEKINKIFNIITKKKLNKPIKTRIRLIYMKMSYMLVTKRFHIGGENVDRGRGRGLKCVDRIFFTTNGNQK